MDRTSPSNRHSAAAANPPGALSESFTLAAAGILGQFVVCRVSGEVGQMVGRVTPNSGDLRGGGDYGSLRDDQCRPTFAGSPDRGAQIPPGLGARAGCFTARAAQAG